jgi:hypothetical protein
MSRDIDRVIVALQRSYNDIVAQQLRVLHPGVDDDGLWFFTRRGCSEEVQVESSTGSAPFLVESDNAPPVTANTVDETIRLVAARLGLSECA